MIKLILIFSTFQHRSYTYVDLNIYTYILKKILKKAYLVFTAGKVFKTFLKASRCEGPIAHNLDKAKSCIIRVSTLISRYCDCGSSHKNKPSNCTSILTILSSEINCFIFVPFFANNFIIQRKSRLIDFQIKIFKNEIIRKVMLCSLEKPVRKKFSVFK